MKACHRMARERGRMLLVDFFEYGPPRGWQSIGPDFYDLRSGRQLLVVRRKDRLRREGWRLPKWHARHPTFRSARRMVHGSIEGVVS